MLKTYLALLIIIVGVGITSKTESTFSPIGLCVALLSTIGGAAYNVYLKQVSIFVRIFYLKFIVVLTFRYLSF